MASDLPASIILLGRTPLFPFEPEPLVLLIVVIFLWRVGRWYPGPRHVACAFLGFFVAAVTACATWGPLETFERTFWAVRLVFLVAGPLVASLLAALLVMRPPQVKTLLDGRAAKAFAAESDVGRDSAWTLKASAVLTALCAGYILVFVRQDLVLLGYLVLVASLHLAVGAVSGLFRFAGLVDRSADGDSPEDSRATSFLVHGLLVVIIAVACPPILPFLLLYVWARRSTAAAMARAMATAVGGP